MIRTPPTDCFPGHAMMTCRTCSPSKQAEALRIAVHKTLVIGPDLGGVGLQDDDGFGLTRGHALQVTQEVRGAMPRQHIQVPMPRQRTWIPMLCIQSHHQSKTHNTLLELQVSPEALVRGYTTDTSSHQALPTQVELAPETAASISSLACSARMTTGPSNTGSALKLGPGPSRPRLQAQASKGCVCTLVTIHDAQSNACWRRIVFASPNIHLSTSTHLRPT